MCFGGKSPPIIKIFKLPLANIFSSLYAMLCFIISTKHKEICCCVIIIKQDSIYEGKVKSSWGSLRETLDKRPLGRDWDRSWCHRHTTSTIIKVNLWFAATLVKLDFLQQIIKWQNSRVLWLTLHSVKSV